MCKRNKRIRISRLTKREYNLVLDDANFTDDQLKIFKELNKDQYYDHAIMLALNMSPRHYYDTKAVVVDKTERIAREYGFIDAILEPQ